MKVVLKKDIEGTGKSGDIVEVASGYARNYLLPNDLAIAATAQAVSEAKQADASLAHKTTRDTELAEEIKAKIEGKTIKISAKGGEGGKLFGSITTKDISEALLKEYEVVVKRKQVDIKEAIKSFGTFDVKIRLYKGVVATINIVIKEEK